MQRSLTREGRQQPERDDEDSDSRERAKSELRLKCGEEGLTADKALQILISVSRRASDA